MFFLKKIAVLLGEQDVVLVFVRTTYHVSMAIAEFIELSLENLVISSNGMKLQSSSWYLQ